MQRKAAGKGVELADAKAVKKAFVQVEQHFAGLTKVMQHNGQVVQMGFYKNDIWLETFRLIMSDLAETVEEMCKDTTIDSRLRMNEEGTVDLESYWQDANETVKKQMATANEKKPEDGTPADPLIERADDEKPIIFGGDGETNETSGHSEEHEAAEGRDCCGEEHDEARDAPDTLPEVSEPGGADATA